MEKQNTQRSVSTAELLTLEAAFTNYVAGVTFRDEEARLEALLEYERGYQNLPPEAGGTAEEYGNNTIPYLAPNIALAGDMIPTYKQGFLLAEAAVREIEEVFIKAKVALTRCGKLNTYAANTSLNKLYAAKVAAEEIKAIAFNALVEEGGTV